MRSPRGRSCRARGRAPSSSPNRPRACRSGAGPVRRRWRRPSSISRGRQASPASRSRSTAASISPGARPTARSPSSSAGRLDYLWAMIPAGKDIDPASEDLLEDDEESSLPEFEPEGTLAAGRAAIARHLKLAPSAPGVYRMIDAAGEVLYVGKAKNIRKRLAAYARPHALDARIARMIAATASLEFVTTATETEALLLEANLIKRLRPRFNVLLRDDKSFPYILITSDHWAPQLLKHRGARTRPGRYYGPFANAGAVNRTINALQRAFLLRSCSDAFFAARSRPCLLHQIKRCSAPCTGEIDFAAYGELVREANEFLSGRSRAVQEQLAAAM